MKQFILFISALSLSLTAYCQKISFKTKFQIQNSQVETKQKGGIAVKYIKAGSLKNGHNYLNLANGNILYIEYANKEVKSFTITKPDGTLVNKLVRGPGTLSYQCEGFMCSCKGDADCNDMFESAHCGDAYCSDDVCICVRN